MSKAVSPLTEERLRNAFKAAGAQTLDGAKLTHKLRHATAIVLCRQVAWLMIGNAVKCGLLLREGGPPAYTYAISPDWQRPGVRARRANAGERVSHRHEPATAYVGPAFAADSLAPVLGPRPADPEVMPPEIADMVDSLHQRFYRHASGVVEV